MNQEELSGGVWVAALRILAAGLVLTAAWGLLPQRAVAAAVPAMAGGQRWVVPVGRAVGIKLFSDGVVVVGLADVSTAEGASCPARACGLQTGDIITHIGPTEVDSIEAVQAVLRSAAGQPVSVRCLRGKKQVQVTARAALCSGDGSYKLGAFIRDSMAGIGTVTYYEPDTGAFGALGHGINDMDTAQLTPLRTGGILYAQVSSVKKGSPGDPGELHGAFQVRRDLGTLFANTEQGIFGTLSQTPPATQALPVAARREVSLGTATILSNIAGDNVEEYSIEITKVFSGGEGRDLMIKVTDPGLLAATGGIVQGMSGSPILQNGRAVGAVTHVLVSDPTQGYGILLETMLNTADSILSSQAA